MTPDKLIGGRWWGSRLIHLRHEYMGLCMWISTHINQEKHFILTFEYVLLSPRGLTPTHLGVRSSEILNGPAGISLVAP